MLNKVISTLFTGITSSEQAHTRIGFSSDGIELVMTDSKILITMDNLDKDGTKHLYGKITSQTDFNHNFKSDVKTFNYSNKTTNLNYQPVIDGKKGHTFTYTLTITRATIDKLLIFKKQLEYAMITANSNGLYLSLLPYGNMSLITKEIDFSNNKLVSTQEDDNPPSISFNLSRVTLQFLSNIMKMQGKNTLTFNFDDETKPCYVSGIDAPFKDFIFMFKVINCHNNSAYKLDKITTTFTLNTSALDFNSLKSIMDKYTPTIHIYNEDQTIYGLMPTKSSSFYKFIISQDYNGEEINLFFDLQEFIQAFEYNIKFSGKNSLTTLQFANNGLSLNTPCIDSLTLIDNRYNINESLIKKLENVRNLDLTHYNDYSLTLDINEYKTALDNFKDSGKYISYDFANKLWLGTSLKTAYLAKSQYEPVYETSNDYKLEKEIVFKDDVNCINKAVFKSHNNFKDVTLSIKDDYIIIQAHDFTITTPLDEYVTTYPIVKLMDSHKKLMQEDKETFDRDFTFNEINTPLLKINVLFKKPFDND